MAYPMRGLARRALLAFILRSDEHNLTSAAENGLGKGQVKRLRLGFRHQWDCAGYYFYCAILI